MAPKKIKSPVPPTPPGPPTTGAPLSVEEFLNQALPSTTAPVGTPTTTPNVPTLGAPTGTPTQTSSRLARQAEAKLRTTATSAANLGISVPAELMPADYQNIPILKKKEEKPGFWGKLGQGALSAVSDVTNIIDIPKRIVVAGIDEAADVFTKGDTSGSFLGNIADPTYGFGDVVGDITDNKWVNRAIGFAGDVLLDPLTYLTAGGSAVVKTGVAAAGKTAAREVAEIVVKETAEGLLKRGAKEASVDALKLADDAFRNAQKALDIAIEGGDEAFIATMRKAYDEAGQAVTAASMDIAKEMGTKSGAVLLAEEARQAAYDKWATATGAARDAAGKELDRATEDVVRAIGRKQARRSYRGEAREALAEQARRTRQIAENQLESLRTVPVNQFTPDRLLRIQTLEQTIADLSDEVIKDIAVRGYNAIKGDVARTLGVTSRSRLSLGRRALFIPGSEKLTTALGTTAVSARLAAINKLPGGERILKAITPMGRKGLFSPDEVLEWRMALRTGKVKADDAVRYTALLKANKDYNQLFNATRRKAGQEVAQAIRTVSDEDASVVAKMLDTPQASWNSLGIKPSPNQLAIYDRARSTFDGWLNEANAIIDRFGGTPLTGIPNYFPHAQSDDALRWISANPDAAKRVAFGIGKDIDAQFLADNFIERTLVAGKKWFGKTLTDADIRGGVRRLNEIARDPRYGNLNFDFFETDVRRALAKYGENHARFMATMQSIDGLASKIGGGRYGDLGAKEVIKEIRPAYAITAKDDIVDALQSLQDTINNTFVVESVLGPTPGAQDVIDIVLGKVDDLLAKVESKVGYDVQGNIIRLPLVDKTEVLDDLYYIQDLASTFASELDDGTLSTVVRLTQDQFDQLNLRLFNINQLNEMFPEGAFNKLEDVILNRLEDIQFVEVLGPALRQMEDGWKILQTGLISGDAVTLAVKEELESIFSNIKRIENPKVAKNLERTIGSFNRFFKSYATATPGFHVRNAISNAFQLLAAGVDFENVAPALKHYNNYWRINRRRVQQGLEALTPGQYARSLTDVPYAERELIRSALLSVDLEATQFAEAIGSASGRVGITGKELGPDAILGGVRSIPGTPIRASRKLGQLVEGTNRFILTYDGLRKGLNPSEAFARTNKFLFDYSDLSSTDRVVRQIIPFWMWTSRNLPLQLENMLTNPRAYSWYSSLKKNLMDEEQPEYLPNYLKRGGAFTVGGMVVEPNLGFPGAGQPSPLEEIAKLPLYAVTGNETAVQESFRNLLGSSSPIVQAPIEYATGTNLFGGYPLVSEYSKLTPEQQRTNYILNTLLPSASWLGRIAQAGGVAPTSEGARQILGLSPISTYGKTPEEIAAQESERQSSALYRYFGLPIRTLTEREQISEIDRRRRALEALIALEERRRQG